MHQTYDRGSDPMIVTPDERTELEGRLALPEGVIEEVIEISKRRAEVLGCMKDALLRGDLDKVKRIAEVLCGLAHEHE